MTTKKKSPARKQKLYKTFFLGTGYVEDASNAKVILVHKRGFKTPVEGLLAIRSCIAKQFKREIEYWRRRRQDGSIYQDINYTRTATFVDELWIQGDGQSLDFEFEEDLEDTGFNVHDWCRREIPKPFVFVDRAGSTIANANKGRRVSKFTGTQNVPPTLTVFR